MTAGVEGHIPAYLSRWLSGVVRGRRIQYLRLCRRDRAQLLGDRVGIYACQSGVERRQRQPDGLRPQHIRCIRNCRPDVVTDSHQLRQCLSDRRFRADIPLFLSKGSVVCLNCHVRWLLRCGGHVVVGHEE
ncbi:MAG: hypothetical protein KC547_20630, partial [Anaerolineae bacterium]|nr:hypothetical protein [Anaerolineae bacterium]